MCLYTSTNYARLLPQVSYHGRESIESIGWDRICWQDATCGMRRVWPARFDLWGFLGSERRQRQDGVARGWWVSEMVGRVGWFGLVGRWLSLRDGRTGTGTGTPRAVSTIQYWHRHQRPRASISVYQPTSPPAAPRASIPHSAHHPHHPVAHQSTGLPLPGTAWALPQASAWPLVPQ